MFVVFFFFKQKTAYELRISDWSSDVCSSDLGFQAEFDIGDLFLSAYLIGTEIGTLAGGGRCGELTSRGYAACGIGAFKQRRRSEEHTSELQSLMRISYAVFCLKKNIRHLLMPSTYIHIQSKTSSTHAIMNEQ